MTIIWVKIFPFSVTLMKLKGVILGEIRPNKTNF